MDFKLYRPVKGKRSIDRRCTQGYGDNFKINGKWMYGDIVKAWKKHEGLDYGMGKPGQKGPCYSSVDGEVTFTGRQNGWGNCVWISFDKYELVYAHLDSIACKVGPIKSMEQVGIIGNTGTGNGGVHLHYGLRPKGEWWIDPTKFITERTESSTTVEPQDFGNTQPIIPLDPEIQLLVDNGIFNGNIENLDPRMLTIVGRVYRATK